MQLTNIYVARHGETEYNRTRRIQGRGINEPLNDTGRSQARAIARFLRGTNIDHIFASSLERSVQTAEIIAGHLNLSVRSHVELDEMNFGIIEGQPIDEIKEHLQQLHKAWSSGNTGFALEEGESPEAVLKRVKMRTDLLIEEHSGQNILLVLHGRLIRVLLAHWLGYGLSRMHEIEHQNGALNHLQMRTGQPIKPLFLNKTDHLQVQV